MKSSTKPLFMGASYIHLDQVDSTQSYLEKLLDHNAPSEGFAVTTDFQSLGSGQLGKKWESDPGLNILMSIYLTPTFLHIDDFFYLNIITSLAIIHVVDKYLPSTITHIKWPNDIYIDNQKTAGILIKNTIQNRHIEKSILGIGVNILQKQFNEPKATSLSVHAHQKLDVQTIKTDIFHALEQYYLILKTKNYLTLKKAYEGKLYLKDIESSFLDLQLNQMFKGIIRGINDAGHLIIETHQQFKMYPLHKIKYL